MRCRVEHERRNSISTSIFVLFCSLYNINTMAHHWRERSTKFTKESERIENPQIKIVKCVGAKAQDEKMHWITSKKKKKMVVTFNIQNFHLLTLSSPTEEILHWVTDFHRVIDFPSQSRGMQYQSHWIRNFRFTFSYFGFVPLSVQVWTSLFVSDRDFSVFKHP